jgi:hypothetical protein
MASSQRALRHRARGALVIVVLVLFAAGLVGSGKPHIAASLLLASLWLFLAFRHRPYRPLPSLSRKTVLHDEAEEP